MLLHLTLVRPFPISMIQIPLRAGRLASNLLKPGSFRLHTCKPIAPISALDRKSFVFGLTNNRWHSHPRNLPRKFSNISGVRYCSYQRSMCLARDDLSGSVDVTRGREVLPTNVKPVHYDLTLEPDFEKFTYEGKVIIEYVQPKV